MKPSTNMKRQVLESVVLIHQILGPSHSVSDILAMVQRSHEGTTANRGTTTRVG